MYKIGFLIYNDVQPIDFIGPWEVLSIWKKELKAPIQLYLIAEHEGSIICQSQLTLTAHMAYQDAPNLDYLFVPGGQGRLSEVNNPKTITFIEQQAQCCKKILSVCTGTFLLAAAGLLHHQEATTYWRALNELRKQTPVHVKPERIVKGDKIWCAGGLSSGIDLAFALIETLTDTQTAGQVQLLFEYFPLRKCYCTLQTKDSLPPYPGTDEQDISELPEYIKNYLDLGGN